MLIQSISDLYSYFLRNKYLAIPVLHRVRGINQFLGIVPKTTLLRLYNNPLQGGSFSKAMKCLVTEVKLDDFIAEVQLQQLEGIDVLYKVRQNFHLQSYLVRDFLIEFKVVKTVISGELEEALKKHELPVVILNKIWQPIFENDSTPKVKKAMGSLRNIGKLIEKVNSASAESSGPSLKTIKNERGISRFHLQRLTLQGGLVYMVTFFEWGKIEV